ncbi:putative cation/H+ exchanger, CPA1 family, na+/H+ exchanger NHX -type [Rosa chinensis]|uniref:Putative cation/H+ exchanger, CPA1 family, na+/H+ exchanger NHX-type n=1 Tax=Rosa chinensis TaxID=74649 RepID=A0A2P6QMT6_ROSCH|nr:putative cation/H+ exchanger, CPA1 family, na+/H+ exchanger NHX -type [Rosa chinensis]
MTSSEPSSPNSFIVLLLTNWQDSIANIRSVDISRPTSLRILLSTPSQIVDYYWRKFDNAFMRPVFAGGVLYPSFHNHLLNQIVTTG